MPIQSVTLECVACGTQVPVDQLTPLVIPAGMPLIFHLPDHSERRVMGEGKALPFCSLCLPLVQPAVDAYKAKTPVS